MCINAPVSLAAYVVGCRGAAQLWTRKFRAEAAFYAVTVQMQLVDFVIHVASPGDGGACPAANAAASVVGMVVNHCEPLGMLLGGALCGRRRGGRGVLVGTAVYVPAAILYSAGCLGDGRADCTQVTRASAPFLDWRWNSCDGKHAFYAIFLMYTLLLTGAYCQYPVLHGAIVAGSYAVSYWLYKPFHAVGTMWCLAACMGPYLYIFLASLGNGHGPRVPAAARRRLFV